MAEHEAIHVNIESNITYLKDLLGIGEGFDIVMREYDVCGKQAASLSINGMTNDVLVSDILEDMIFYNYEPTPFFNLDDLMKKRATHTQVKIVETMEEAVTSLLSGEMLFLLDGDSRILVLDVRAYPVRSPSESTLEKVTRGSRDSFVETIVFNTALIRRRLRDPNLRFKIMKIGSRSKCDVAIAYIKDVTNVSLLKTIEKKLSEINIDGVPMAEKAIEEYIVGGSKWNILPKVRYTERPDVAVVHLLEGHVCLITDTTPNIMILPTTMWHHVQHVEEYHQNIVVGSYLRLVRLLGIVFSVMLPPLWLALVLDRHLLPEALAFLGPRDPGIIPIGIQFILAEIGFELVRMATVHVPSSQATALGFIGAFMLGDFATKVGLFGNEIIFYIAVAAVGSFATPSVEFSLAMRLYRLFLLVAVMFLRFPGFIGGVFIILLMMGFTKSFGIPYLWPLVPFNFGGLKDVVFRLPIPNKVLRPAVLKPQDLDRMEDSKTGNTQKGKDSDQENEQQMNSIVKSYEKKTNNEDRKK